MRELVQQVLDGNPLTLPQSEVIFGAIVNGEMDAIEMAGTVIAMKARGEQPAELAGAARALRAAALPFPDPGYPVADSCGTGGDGAHTVNISTAVAFVAAACGLPVAKHANRSVSSRCGSIDVLEALGAETDVEPALARACLEEAGVCVLFAPRYHEGFRHAVPVRKALATRTIFNLLGPLINPARPAWQLVGVYDPALCRPIAECLKQLGCTGALIVHGQGIDEIGLHGTTQAARLQDGVIEDLVIEPEALGLGCARVDSLRGGGPEDNAIWLADILKGIGTKAHLDAVAINTAGLLWISGRARTLNHGVELARDALTSGAPYSRLQRFIEVSHGA